ncbi:YppG family protein [Aciduricibacillus chroicocephali]|uniref:YppG family protein n=1 Tax=Aciduricibacillus chroicocephali TaxID=3054939 RepID=A0ABY9KXR6_9BACI|nr:YppG family protein [Bacillaceae bacterium 44XB]
MNRGNSRMQPQKTPFQSRRPIQPMTPAPRRNGILPRLGNQRGREERFSRPGNQRVQEENVEKKSSIIEQLKKEDGQWDLDKLMAVSNQLQKMYGQVSPLISRFIK